MKLEDFTGNIELAGQALKWMLQTFLTGGTDFDLLDPRHSLILTWWMAGALDWLCDPCEWADPDGPATEELLGLAKQYQAEAHALAVELTELLQLDDGVGPEDLRMLNSEEWWGSMSLVLDEARKRRRPEAAHA